MCTKRLLLTVPYRYQFVPYKTVLSVYRNVHQKAAANCTVLYSPVQHTVAQYRTLQQLQHSSTQPSIHYCSHNSVFTTCYCM